MSAMLRGPNIRTAIRVVLFLAGFGILILLVIELDVNAIVRLITRTGWNLVLIVLIYGGCRHCQVERVAGRVDG